MDVLKNKRFENYDYLNRYTGAPYYFHTVDEKEVYGLSHNMSKDIPWVAHKVALEDTLDSLALKYYNNPTYWWIIAYFNDIQDPFIKLNEVYDILKIPSITSVSFEDLR